MSTSWLNLGQVACVVLAGCHSNSGSRAASSPRSTSAATQTWRNATYTVTCDGVVPGSVRATLKNGATQVPADVSQNPYYDYYDVRFEAAATGDVDVDGDGRPDTVVLLQCSPQPSSGIVEEGAGLRRRRPARRAAEPGHAAGGDDLGAGVRPRRAVGPARRHRRGVGGLRPQGFPRQGTVTACHRSLA